MTASTQRHKQVLRVILIEGSANLLVLIAKIVVGISTGSMAVLGDAIHSLTDVANNFVAWLVIRISAKPADIEHPYGHRKFETIAVFALALLLSVMAIELAINAFKEHEPVITTGRWELITMLVVLVVNIILSTWQRYWASRLQSDILLADASHTFADVLITLVVIAGWQLSAAGYVWVDQLCALGVSVLVLSLAYGLFRRALPTLVDEFAIDPTLLSNAVRSVKGVRQVLRVRSRWIGSDRAVDMIIRVDPELSTDESHLISDRIESLIESRFEITDISIHVEPYHRPTIKEKKAN
jgi:cation diffusion facilitator family transporter